MRDALVNQAGFFGAGHHINGVAQYLVGTVQKNIAVARFAQGLRGHGTHLGTGKVGQALGKTRQTIPTALQGVGRQVAVVIQAVALAHGFFDVFHALDVAVLEAANFQAKAVGSQIHSCEQCSVVHVGARKALVSSAGSIAPAFWCSGRCVSR